MDDEGEEKKANGVKGCVVKQKLTFDDYVWRRPQKEHDRNERIQKSRAYNVLLRNKGQI
jgi:hypothetical protein